MQKSRLVYDALILNYKTDEIWLLIDSLTRTWLNKVLSADEIASKDIHIKESYIWMTTHYSNVCSE